MWIEEGKKRGYSWLVQRSKWKDDLLIEDVNGFDSLMDFIDLMGAAEFEFGRLPASLKRMTKHKKEYDFIKMLKRKDSLGQQMYIYCNKENSEEYKKYVRKLIKDNYSTKLYNGLYDYMNSDITIIKNKKTDFWWDVEHDFFIFFGDNKIEYIKLAFEKLDEKWHDELHPYIKPTFIERIKNIFKKNKKS
jgi:hypothetical protein